MAYIGNAKTPLLFASNVRDDLRPDGLVGEVYTKITFDLSQEVPGGEESNVTVVRRKFITDALVQGSTDISVSSKTISTTDGILAAALSVVQPRSANYEGDNLKISFQDTSISSKVVSVVYTGTQIQITLEKEVGSDFAEGEQTVTLTRQYYGAWEILDPKTDYEIHGDFGTDFYNRKISLSEAPQLDDIVYVLHRGDATYNFVPSPNSVGLEQLSNNLKDFRCDRFTAPGGTTKQFTLSQQAINERTLLVTVNGSVSEGDDLSAGIVGDWKLVESEDNTQVIEFHTIPDQGTKIRVLHLGFVSGLRRAVFAPGQEPASIQDRSVTEEKLENNSISTRTIRNSAVTTQKIQDSSVTASKILLNSAQNDGIKISYADGTKNLIGVTNNSTSVHTKTDFSIKTDTEDLLTVSSSAITARASTTSLGTSTNKFSNMFLSGSATVDQSLTVGQGVTVTGQTNVTGATSVTGDVSVVGNISVTGTVDTVDVLDLFNTVVALQQKVSTLIPVGTIMASGRATAHTTDGVWLVCDGSSVATADYQDLFAAIGYAFGGSGASFNLPDLRRRVPVGKSTSDNLADAEGLSVENRLLTHNHTSAQHTHDLSNHTHTIPGHKHSITTSSTLRIESTQSKPSGAHTTNITHTHLPTTGTEFSTTAPYNTTNTATSTLSHTHTFSHQHTNQTTLKGGVDHTHVGSTTSTGDHTHDFEYSSWKKWTLGSGNYSLYAPDSTTNAASFIPTSGGHSHTISTGSPLAPSNPFGNGYDHQHTFTTTPHSGLTTSPDSAENNLSHIHRFTIPTFTGTSSNLAGETDGAHSHTTDTFLGSIGNDSANEGNNTFASSAPSTNTSGLATYPDSNLTGDTKTPYIILNFIIKAKNS